MNLLQLYKWYRTRTGLMVFGLIELGLVYVLGSLAINSGSLWQYSLAILFLFLCLAGVIRILKTHKR